MEERTQGAYIENRGSPERRYGNMACTLRELTGWWGKQIIKQIIRRQGYVLNQSYGVDPRGCRN